MDFDFNAGGEHHGIYFPPLKSLSSAVKARGAPESMAIFNYQPGNGTMYEVVFITYSINGHRRTMMTILNMRKTMELIGDMGIFDIGYMAEKLGLGEGDCYALIPLINKYFKDIRS